jgi:hypothetical protein
VRVRVDVLHVAGQDRAEQRVFRPRDRLHKQ